MSNPLQRVYELLLERGPARRRFLIRLLEPRGFDLPLFNSCLRVLGIRLTDVVSLPDNFDPLSYGLTMPPRSARSTTMQTLTPQSLLHLKTNSITRARDLNREIARITKSVPESPARDAILARLTEDSYLMELAFLAACYAEQHGLN